MATLADVSAKLDASNDQAEAQTKSIDQLNTNFSLFLRELGEDDSAEREEKREASVRGGAAPASAPASGGSLFGGKSLLGFASGIGMGMLKRGVPGLIATMFADEIADYIYNETGNAELSDAIGRSITFGGIGLIFGKRFAVLGAAIGILLNEDNKTKLTQLGETAEKLAKDFGIFKDGFPDLSGILTGISTAFGNTVTNLDNLLKGDFDKLDVLDSLEDLAITVGSLFTLFMPGKAISLALRALTKPFRMAFNAVRGTATAAGAAGVTASTATATTATAAASTVTKPRNFTVNKAGEFIGKSGKKLTGAALTTAQATQAADTAKLGRFNKLVSFGKKVPLLGSLVSLGHIGYILSSDQSKEDKVANITGALGGLAGATGGSILGGLLGTLGLPFIGTAVGGGLGGILGYFAGEYITKALAQYLLDMPITAFPDWTGLNDMMNGEVKTGSGGGTAIQSGGGAGEFDVGSTSPQNTRANNPPSAMAIANAYNQANSGGSGASYVDASNNVSNYTDASTNQGITVPFAGSGDPYANMYVG
jgi:hypothetical protein